MDRKEEGDHDHNMCIIRDTCLYFLEKCTKKQYPYTNAHKDQFSRENPKNPGVKIKRQNKYEM